MSHLISLSASCTSGMVSALRLPTLPLTLKRSMSAHPRPRAVPTGPRAQPPPPGPSHPSRPRPPPTLPRRLALALSPSPSQPQPFGERLSALRTLSTPQWAAAEARQRQKRIDGKRIMKSVYRVYLRKWAADGRGTQPSIKELKRRVFTPEEVEELERWDEGRTKGKVEKRAIVRKKRWARAREREEVRKVAQWDREGRGEREIELLKMQLAERPMGADELKFRKRKWEKKTEGMERTARRKEADKEKKARKRRLVLEIRADRLRNRQRHEQMNRERKVTLAAMQAVGEARGA